MFCSASRDDFISEASVVGDGAGNAFGDAVMAEVVGVAVFTESGVLGDKLEGEQEKISLPKT